MAAMRLLPIPIIYQFSSLAAVQQSGIGTGFKANVCQMYIIGFERQDGTASEPPRH